ncbi:MAG: hypothetical protein AAFV71_26870, partial [Cyanobacteria bacterium J06633_8]
MTNQTTNRFQSSPKIIFTIAFFGFLFGLYFIFTRKPTPTSGLMSVSKIVREKDDFIGKYVTIRSKYIEKLGP